MDYFDRPLTDAERDFKLLRAIFREADEYRREEALKAETS